jgi:hypothetical protein
MNRWLPFRFTPASWGLVGNAYLEAEAHYLLSGESLDRRLLEIRLADDPLKLRKALIELELCYEHITPYEAAKQRVELAHPPGPEHDLAILEVDREHGKIDHNTYSKRRADLKDEPWIGIVNSGFNPDQGIDGVFFEFDWNTKWIEYLRAHGYVGHSAEQVLDDWFSDVCRSHSLGDQPFAVRDA